MSLDVTYHCEALTTAGIWDHQVCLSILSAFLLTNGDEMYHHSRITMKASLEDELKKVRFMEHAVGTTHPHDKGLAYANICDLTKTWYQESKGMGKWPPATHTKDSKAPPSFTQAKVHTLVQHFQKGPDHFQATQHSREFWTFIPSFLSSILSIGMPRWPLHGAQ